MTYISLKTSTIQITGKNGHVIIMLSKQKQTNQTGYHTNHMGYIIIMMVLGYQTNHIINCYQTNHTCWDTSHIC